MRKALMNDSCLAGRTPEEWLELKRIAKVEITSEDPKFPMESALSFGKGCGWRAATIGTQVIRLIFDEPTDLRRIKLVFYEAETERTQQFTLRWACDPNDPSREIVRQQWNFSPRGSVPDTGPRCETGVRDTGRSAPRRVTQFGRYGLHKRAIRADQLCASAAICALEAAATARRIASKGGERSAACPLPGPQPPVVSPPRSGS